MTRLKRWVSITDVYHWIINVADSPPLPKNWNYLNSVLDTVIIWCLPSRLRIWQPKNTSLLDKNKKCAPKERTEKMFPSHKLPHECSPITEWEREKTLFTKVFSRYRWQFIRFVWCFYYSTFLLFCQLLFKIITKKENLKWGSLILLFG